MLRWWVLAAAVLLPGCFNGLLLTPTTVGGAVEETPVACAKHFYCCDKIALIDVDGLIVNAKESGFLGGGGDNPVSLFRERLDAAAEDKHVKAVVLRINSPGGGVTASDIMYQELCRFRHETGKPVVACMMDVCASGGYYLAMGCDRVYACPTSVTGSIGVIMSLYNASGLATTLGISSVPVKSGPNKDIGNPLRPMSEPERLILQGMVDCFYEQFVQVVVRARHLPEERVRELADGRVYTGIEAHKLGLVDEIGYPDDALRCARDMACLKDAAVVAYDRCDGYRGSVYAAAPKLPAEIRVKLDLPGMTAPSGAGFLYLLQAGAPR